MSDELRIYFQSLLDNWNSIKTIEELNYRWQKCKFWIMNKADTFDVRKEMDLMCNDYYQKNLKRIENNF